MFLLVDPVASPAAFVLFDGGRKSVTVERADLSGREFETFLETLDAVCRRHGVEPRALEGIACVRGPAGFTGIRVVSLTLSTLSLTFGTPLFELDAFELRHLSGAAFPVIFRANRDEYAFAEKPRAPFEIRKKSEIPEGQYSWTGLESDFEGRRVRIESETDYPRAVRNLDLSFPVKKIEPLYLKKPHITKSPWTANS